MTTEPLTDAEIAEAEKLCEAATPGPWRASMNGYAVRSEDEKRPIICRVQLPNGPLALEGFELWIDDSEFIAAARTLLPRCLAALKEERAGRIVTVACGPTLVYTLTNVDEVIAERDNLRAKLAAAAEREKTLESELDDAESEAGAKIDAMADALNAARAYVVEVQRVHALGNHHPLLDQIAAALETP